MTPVNYLGKSEQMPCVLEIALSNVSYVNLFASKIAKESTVQSVVLCVTNFAGSAIIRECRRKLNDC